MSPMSRSPAQKSSPQRWSRAEPDRLRLSPQNFTDYESLAMRDGSLMGSPKGSPGGGMGGGWHESVMHSKAHHGKEQPGTGLFGWLW